MDVDVTVTDAGLLQVSVDGVSWPPLPVDVVSVLAAKVPDAQAAAAQYQVTAAMRTLTDVLMASGAELAANVVVGPEGVEAEVDDESYERAQEELGVTPDSGGALRYGRVVIRRKPAPEPEPTPTDPTIDPILGGTA